MAVFQKTSEFQIGFNLKTIDSYDFTGSFMGGKTRVIFTVHFEWGLRFNTPSCSDMVVSATMKLETKLKFNMRWKLYYLDGKQKRGKYSALTKQNNHKTESSAEIRIKSFIGHYRNEGVTEENGEMKFRLEIEAKCLSWPRIGNIKDFPEKDMRIMVGGSQTKCIYVPAEAVDDFPLLLQFMLRAYKHLRIPDLTEKHLKHIISLNFAAVSFIENLDVFSSADQLSRGVLYVRYSFNEPPESTSSLFTFFIKLERMKNIHRSSKFHRLFMPQNLRSIPRNTRLKFTKEQNSNWMNLIGHKLCFPAQKDWKVELFFSEFNGVQYLGISIVSLQYTLLDCTFTLILKGGCVEGNEQSGHETVKFVISTHGKQAQYSYATPVLTTMDDLVRIGMNAKEATIELLIEKNSSRNDDDDNCEVSVVKFCGIKNYTINIGDTLIQINKEVLQYHSEYFVDFHNSGSLESDRNRITLQEDEPDAFLLLLKIVYGCAAPITYLHLAKMLVIAKKYAFSDMLRYFDALIATLLREKKLPLPWAYNIDIIAHEFNLYTVQECLHFSTIKCNLPYHFRPLALKYVSEVEPDDPENELMVLFPHGKFFLARTVRKNDKMVQTDD